MPRVGHEFPTQTQKVVRVQRKGDGSGGKGLEKAETRMDGITGLASSGQESNEHLPSAQLLRLWEQI